MRARARGAFALVALTVARECSEPGADCSETECCTKPLMTCFRKNKFWAGCKESCAPGVDPLDPKEDRTPWSCEPLAPGGRGGDHLAASQLPQIPQIPLPPSAPQLPAQPPASPLCSLGVSKGALQILGVGVPTFAAGQGGRVVAEGLLLGHSSGYSVLNSCVAQYTPESFARFQLLGGKVTFAADLSRVGCACNVAFYIISQPARDSLGHFSPGPKGDYYCDANDVQTQWCPEVDIMEANNRVFAATAHTCESPTHGHYSRCDRSGKGQSTRDIPGSYGPGPSYKINTDKPFIVSTEFMSPDHATLTGMKTVLTQEGREVVLEHSNCDGAYLAKLSSSLVAGMAIRISYWGKKAETMAWLDEPPCSKEESCKGAHAGIAAISHIAVQGGLAPPMVQITAPPPPASTAPLTTQPVWSVPTTRLPIIIYQPPSARPLSPSTRPPELPMETTVLPQWPVITPAQHLPPTQSPARARRRSQSWSAPKLLALVAALSIAGLLAAVFLCGGQGLPPQHLTGGADYMAGQRIVCAAPVWDEGRFGGLPGHGASPAAFNMYQDPFGSNQHVVGGPAVPGIWRRG